MEKNNLLLWNYNVYFIGYSQKGWSRYSMCKLSPKFFIFNQNENYSTHQYKYISVWLNWFRILYWRLRSGWCLTFAPNSSPSVSRRSSASYISHHYLGIYNQKGCPVSSSLMPCSCSESHHVIPFISSMSKLVCFFALPYSFWRRLFQNFKPVVRNLLIYSLNVFMAIL